MAVSMTGLKWGFWLIAVVGLSACASFPVSSMYKLRNFNPVTTDIHRLRFAVRVPEDMQIPKDGVRLMLSTEHRERENLYGDFHLDSIDDRTALGGVERIGTQVHAFRIALEDIERFKRLRQKIQIEKSRGADGTLEVKADVCRTKPDLPSQILIPTFVNASETDGYVALLLDVDILSRVGRQTAPDCARLRQTVLEVAPECTKP